MDDIYSYILSILPDADFLTIRSINKYFNSFVDHNASNTIRIHKISIFNLHKECMNKERDQPLCHYWPKIRSVYYDMNVDTRYDYNIRDHDISDGTNIIKLKVSKGITNDGIKNLTNITSLNLTKSDHIDDLKHLTP